MSATLSQQPLRVAAAAAAASSMRLALLTSAVTTPASGPTHRTRPPPLRRVQPLSTEACTDLPSPLSLASHCCSRRTVSTNATSTSTTTNNANANATANTNPRSPTAIAWVIPPSLFFLLLGTLFAALCSPLTVQPALAECDLQSITLYTSRGNTIYQQSLAADLVVANQSSVVVSTPFTITATMYVHVEATGSTTASSGSGTVEAPFITFFINGLYNQRYQNAASLYVSTRTWITTCNQVNVVRIGVDSPTCVSNYTVNFTRGGCPVLSSSAGGTAAAKSSSVVLRSSSAVALSSSAPRPSSSVVVVPSSSVILPSSSAIVLSSSVVVLSSSAPRPSSSEPEPSSSVAVPSTSEPELSSSAVVPSSSVRRLSSSAPEPSSSADELAVVLPSSSSSSSSMILPNSSFEMWSIDEEGGPGVLAFAVYNLSGTATVNVLLGVRWGFPMLGRFVSEGTSPQASITITIGEWSTGEMSVESVGDNFLQLYGFDTRCGISNNITLYFSSPHWGTLTYNIVVANDLCSVLGDPMFLGLRGQSFQVHGIDGAVYALISAPTYLLNARFKFLTGPRACPVLPTTGRRSSSCWTHPGSYLSEIGVRTKSGQRLRIVAGTAAVGFAHVLVNEERVLDVGNALELDDGFGFVARNSTHELSMQIGSFVFVVENSDGFVNLRTVRVLASEWGKVSRQRVHGLLGQTWQSKGKRGAGHNAAGGGHAASAAANAVSVAKPAHPRVIQTDPLQRASKRREEEEQGGQDEVAVAVAAMTEIQEKPTSGGSNRPIQRLKQAVDERRKMKDEEPNADSKPKKKNKSKKKKNKKKGKKKAKKASEANEANEQTLVEPTSVESEAPSEQHQVDEATVVVVEAAPAVAEETNAIAIEPGVSDASAEMVAHARDDGGDGGVTPPTETDVQETDALAMDAQVTDAQATNEQLLQVQMQEESIVETTTVEDSNDNTQGRRRLRHRRLRRRLLGAPHQHGPSAQTVLEGAVDDYVVMDDDLFGSDFVYNRFEEEEDVNRSQQPEQAQQQQE